MCNPMELIDNWHQITFIPLTSATNQQSGIKSHSFLLQAIANPTQARTYTQPIEPRLHIQPSFQLQLQLENQNINYHNTFSHNVPVNSIQPIRLQQPDILVSSNSPNSPVNHADTSTQSIPTPKTQKPSSLNESDYKISDNGKFECLIINKETGKICNKKFKHRSSIKRHKNSVHDNFKPFKCELCSLSFARKNVRTLHIRA
eukprot:465123_1